MGGGTDELAEEIISELEQWCSGRPTYNLGQSRVGEALKGSTHSDVGVAVVACNGYGMEVVL